MLSITIYQLSESEHEQTQSDAEEHYFTTRSCVTVKKKITRALASRRGASKQPCPLCCKMKQWGRFSESQPPAFNLLCAPSIARQVVSKSGFSASANIVKHQAGTRDEAAEEKPDNRYFRVRLPTGNEEREENKNRR